jgi:hypothetical protein
MAKRPAPCERALYDLAAAGSFISYFLSIANQISAFAQADPSLDFRHPSAAWLPIGCNRASLG